MATAAPTAASAAAAPPKVSTSLQNLHAALQRHSDAQVAYGKQNSDLVKWMLIPVLAFVFLQTGFWGVILPTENEQTSYVALLFRTLIFTVILWTSINLLKNACKRQVTRDATVAIAQAAVK